MVGLANYKELFGNSEIFKVLSHNIYYVVAGLIQTMLALYFAVILNTKLWGRNIYRMIICMPYIINGVAVAYMFQYMIPSSVPLNIALAAAGLITKHISWLGTPEIVNFALAAIEIWKYMGFSMIIFLGALQAVPEDVYEAAKIDGANEWQTFWRITLPIILFVVELLMFLTLAGGLEAFDLPFILTNGGPMGASETFLTKTMETAFQISNFGAASAMAIVLLVMVITLVMIQRRIFLKGDNHD